MSLLKCHPLILCVDNVSSMRMWKLRIFPQDFSKFRGGLDVRGDMTGTHSVYTTQVCTVLYCTAALYCSVLYCCTVCTLHRSVLYCTAVLYWYVLICSTLQRCVLYCTVLYCCTVVCCTDVQHTTQVCTVLLYSVYTTQEEHEIMFHVSTLLPYKQDDCQQVAARALQ